MHNAFGVSSGRRAIISRCSVAQRRRPRSPLSLRGELHTNRRYHQFLCGSTTGLPLKISLRRSVSLLLIAFLGCQPATRENQADPAVLLAKLAQARSAPERIAALDSLSNVDRQVLPPGAPDPAAAVRPLLNATDPLVVAKAGELLAYWGDRSATPALVRLLGAVDPGTRLAAATALSVLADPTATDALVRVAHDVDGTVRAQACNALGAQPQPPPDAVAHALRDGLHDADGAVRAAAASAVGRLGIQSEATTLLALLNDAQPGVVNAAARALGTLQEARAMPALIALLGSPQQTTRCAAATALGTLGDRAAVDPLVRVLQEPETTVRTAALNALARLKDARALDGLLAVAADPDEHLAQRVPYALAALYTPAQFDAFVPHLADTDASARAAAALGLGFADERRAAPPLAHALNDPSGPVRGGAATALGLLGASDRLADIDRVAEHDPEPAVREQAGIGLAIGRAHGGAVDARLLATLSDDNPRARLFAADALGLLQARTAAPSLRRLAQDDPDSDVRNEATLALLRLTRDPDL